jgi:hypothetical protein
LSEKNLERENIFWQKFWGGENLRIFKERPQFLFFFPPTQSYTEQRVWYVSKIQFCSQISPTLHKQN